MESVIHGKRASPELPAVLPKQDSLVKKPGFHILSCGSFMTERGEAENLHGVGPLGYLSHTSGGPEKHNTFKRVK